MSRAQAQVIHLFIVSVLLLTATKSEAHKILLLPLGNKSHLIEFHGLGRELLSRGHEVHIYLSKVDTPTSEVAAAGYKFIHPNTDESLNLLSFDEQEMIQSMDKSVLQQLLSGKKKSTEFQNKVSRAAEIMMGDEETIEKIRNEHFDFAVVDNVMFTHYLFLIPHKLAIPYGGLTTLHEPISNRVPFFPSAFIDIGFSIRFGVDPTQLSTSFKQRFYNFLAIAFHDYYMYGWAQHVFDREQVTVQQILSKIAFHLIDQQYLLSDPTPTTQNVMHVGGLVTRDSKPITEKNLLKFIEGTEHPVIVCSFGSIMGTLTPEIVNKLMNAFRKVPQYRIVMRLKGAEALDKPENLMILDWLPQNDLLGHKKTALLITHSGNNGQGEALHHGVPMVAFYIFGDQEYNADRVARRGFAVKLNLLKFTEEELVDAIHEVITNGTYKERIQKASAIFREDYPAGRAADLVEHVIEFGSDHLRSNEAFEMSLIEFLMLDIVLYFFVIVTIIFALVVLVTKRIFKFLLSKVF